MKNTTSNTVTDTQKGKVVPVNLFVNAALTGYIHLSVELAPGIHSINFSRWYNREELVFEDLSPEPDVRGEITRHGKVIGWFETCDVQYNVGPYQGEPDLDEDYNRHF